MKRLLPLLSIAILISSCSTADKQKVAAAAPVINAIADTALGAAGYGAFTPAFNALSGMALALYEGNDPVVASGNPAVANAVLTAFPTATAASLDKAAATLPVK